MQLYVYTGLHPSGEFFTIFIIDLPVVTEKKITLSKRIHMAAKQWSWPPESRPKGTIQKIKFDTDSERIKEFLKL